MAAAFWWREPETFVEIAIVSSRAGLEPEIKLLCAKQGGQIHSRPAFKKSRSIHTLFSCPSLLTYLFGSVPGS